MKFFIMALMLSNIIVAMYSNDPAKPTSFNEPISILGIQKSEPQTLDATLSFLDVEKEAINEAANKLIPEWLISFGTNASEEFAKVEEMAPSLLHEMSLSKLEENFPSAMHWQNFRKNRYSNVLPSEATRVKLTLLPGDYINASRIELNHAARSDEAVSQSYIATQAPLSQTMTDFWTMVWQENSNVVVMLTRFEEGGKIKAIRYWPEHVDEHLEFEPFTVTTKEIKRIGKISVTSLLITFKEESRVIYHVHYEEWPDFGAPDSTDEMRRLLDVTNACVSRGAQGPVVIHCSAGLGRAGTFITLHSVISNLKTDRVRPDILPIVLALRESRPGMVQSVEQYQFIYSAVRDWISNRGFIRD